MFREAVASVSLCDMLFFSFFFFLLSSSVSLLGMYRFLSSPTLVF